jgi:hypothetical protein
MTERDDGGQAFPLPPASFGLSGDISYAEDGMTLRDYFAAKALQGLIATAEDPYKIRTALATEAYDLADAMLKERAK